MSPMTTRSGITQSKSAAFWPYLTRSHRTIIVMMTDYLILGTGHVKNISIGSAVSIFKEENL